MKNLAQTMVNDGACWKIIKKVSLKIIQCRQTSPSDMARKVSNITKIMFRSVKTPIESLL